MHDINRPNASAETLILKSLAERTLSVKIPPKS